MQRFTNPVLYHVCLWSSRSIRFARLAKCNPCEIAHNLSNPMLLAAVVESLFLKSPLSARLPGRHDWQLNEDHRDFPENQSYFNPDFSEKVKS
jgi:hypothetical protein